jgi:hypothetical protein
MARRPTYTGGLINALSIPSAGFEQYKSQASALGDINQKINSIKDFALTRGEEAAKQQAAAFNAENPIDINEFMNLTPTERKKVFSQNFTTYDQVLNSLRKAELMAEVETSAKLNLSNFKNQLLLGYAQTGEIGIVDDAGVFTAFTTQDVADTINGKVAGFSEIVSSFDPEEVRTFGNTMALEGHGIMEEVYEKEMANLIAARKNDGIRLANDTLATIENQYAKHGLNERSAIETLENGEVVDAYITNDAYLANMYEQNRGMLNSRGMSTDELDSNFDKARQKGLISYLKKFYDVPEVSAEQARAIDDAIARGDFADEGLAAVWNELSDESRKEIRKDVKEWKEGVERAEKKAIEDEEARKAANTSSAVNELLENFMSSQDPTPLLERIKDNPNDYTEGTYADLAQKVIDRDDDPLNTTFYDEIDTDIDFGLVTYAELDFMYNVGMDGKTLNAQQYLTLKSKLFNNITSTAQEQKDELRNNVLGDIAINQISAGFADNKTKRLQAEVRIGSRRIDRFSQGELTIDGDDAYSELVKGYGIGEPLKGDDNKVIVGDDGQPILKMKPNADDLRNFRRKLEDSIIQKVNTNLVEKEIRGTTVAITDNNQERDLSTMVVDSSFSLMVNRFAKENNMLTANGVRFKLPEDNTTLFYILNNKEQTIDILDQLMKKDLNGDYINKDAELFEQIYENDVLYMMRDQIQMLEGNENGVQ